MFVPDLLLARFSLASEADARSCGAEGCHASAAEKLAEKRQSLAQAGCCKERRRYNVIAADDTLIHDSFMGIGR